MRLRLLAVLCVAIGACVHAFPAESQPLTTGFNSSPEFTGGSRAFWLDRAANEGAGIIRLNVSWAAIAPSNPPPGFIAADPASPGYNWGGTDQAIRDLTTHGLQVMLTITWAPRWAEGPGRQSVAPGTWRPSPAELTKFATAAALRYSGHFPDPLHPGSFLPQIRYWQPWNEPNLSTYLNPQWIRSGHGYVAESAIIYRKLLNAFYSAVKAVSRSNLVIAAGTAPFGDPPGNLRIRPLKFFRTFFCLSDGRKLRPLKCPDPPHLDAVDHHAYGVVSPSSHAFNPDDVATPDWYRLARVVREAEHTHHILPAGPKQLWNTEVGWDSRPPDPNGVPIARHARFVEQTMYVLWKQGVRMILWLQIRDAAPIPSYSTTYQGGMYYLDGSPKPAAQALRFPFVTQRLNRASIQAWGRSPEAGPLTIEVQHARRWATVRRLRVRSHQIFLAKIGIRGRAVLRATMPGQTSLTWTQAG